MRDHGINGMVLWPFVCFRYRAEDIPGWVFKHEMCHVYQIQRMGKLRFYATYFYYRLRYGYANHPLELEARAYQLEDLTETEEQILWKLKRGSEVLLNA